MIKNGLTTKIKDLVIMSTCLKKNKKNKKNKNQKKNDAIALNKRIINKETDINKELFEKHFNFQRPSDMLVQFG